MTTPPIWHLQFAAWDDLPADTREVFVHVSPRDGTGGAAFYRLYFYWYNIAHEVGHILRGQYHMMTQDPHAEEVACNAFAVAYWRARGEHARRAGLQERLRVALSTLDDPVPAGEDRKGYFLQHYRELGQTPYAYGHYQFGMVLEQLGREAPFVDTLREVIHPAAAAPSPVASDGYLALALDAALPSRIVAGMRTWLATAEVTVPAVDLVCRFAPALQFCWYG
jgi:hypothetical protein